MHQTFDGSGSHRESHRRRGSAPSLSTHTDWHVRTRPRPVLVDESLSLKSNLPPSIVDLRSIVFCRCALGSKIRSCWTMVHTA